MAITVSEAFVTMRPDFTGFNRNVEGFFRSNARTIALAATGMATAAAGGLFAVVNPARAVEQQFDILQSVTKANNEEMREMAELARTLGADLTLPATSSKDAAVAMTELAKAGIDVNDVLTATKGVLQLTAAGALETGRAAEIVGNALNNFSLNGDQATRVADLLAGAAQSASGEVVDMAEALEAVGSIARESGIPIEDVVTAIALMAKNGTIGAEAGYQLRNMFIQLNSVTPDAAKLMKAVGFEAFDAAGNMKSLPQIIDDLAAATAGMTQEARGFFLDKVFGTRASIAVLNLLKEATSGFYDMSGALTAEGAAAEAAAARNRGLTGAIDGLKSAFETIAIDLGTKLLPKITEIVRGFSGMLVQAETLGPAIVLLGQGIAGGFDQARDAAVGLFNIMATNAPTMIASILGVGAAVALALGPGSIALIAIAGIVAALIGFNTKWNEVFSALPPPVQLAFASTLEAAQEWAGALGSIFNVVIDGINLVANAFILSAKAQAGALAGMAIASGDFERANRFFRLAGELKFNPVENINLSADINSAIHKLREQAEFSINQAAVDAFEAAARAAQARFEGAGSVADAEADAAAKAETLRQQIEALSRASGGASTTLDDLMGSIASGSGTAAEKVDEVAKAIEDLAARMTAAANRITENQTSEVVEAFFDAMIKGVDPDLAISKVRALQALQDQEWSKLVDDLHDKLGVQVPDEFRSMWEQMVETSRTGANDAISEWRDTLRQRLASVGRLLPAGIEPRVGPTTNHYNINVNVPVDASGRVNTRELTDAIVNATVEARVRASLAEAR